MALSKPGERPSSEKSLEVIQIFPASSNAHPNRGARVPAPMLWHALARNATIWSPRLNASKAESRSQKFAEYPRKRQLETDKKAIVGFTGGFRQRKRLAPALRPNAIWSSILNSVSSHHFRSRS